MPLTKAEIEEGLQDFLRPYPRPEDFPLPGGEFETFYNNIESIAQNIAKEVHTPQGLSRELYDKSAIALENDEKAATVLTREREQLTRIHELLEQSKHAEIEYDSILEYRIDAMLWQNIHVQLGKIITHYKLGTKPKGYIRNQNDPDKAMLSIELLARDIGCDQRRLDQLNHIFKNIFSDTTQDKIRALAAEAFIELGGNRERPGRGSEASKALLATLFKDNPERFQGFADHYVETFLDQKTRFFKARYTLPYKLIPAKTLSNPALSKITAQTRKRLSKEHFRTYEGLVKQATNRLLDGSYSQTRAMQPDIVKLHAAIAVGLVMSESSAHPLTVEEFLDQFSQIGRQDERFIASINEIDESLIKQLQKDLKAPTSPARSRSSSPFWDKSTGGGSQRSPGEGPSRQNGHPDEEDSPRSPEDKGPSKGT